jgi:hypothetical protein
MTTAVRPSERSHKAATDAGWQTPADVFVSFWAAS